MTFDVYPNVLYTGNPIRIAVPEPFCRALCMRVRDQHVILALMEYRSPDLHFLRVDPVRRIRERGDHRQFYRGPHLIKPLRRLDRKVGLKGNADLLASEEACASRMASFRTFRCRSYLRRHGSPAYLRECLHQPVRIRETGNAVEHPVSSAEFLLQQLCRGLHAHAQADREASHRPWPLIPPQLSLLLREEKNPACSRREQTGPVG